MIGSRDPATSRCDRMEKWTACVSAMQARTTMRMCTWRTPEALRGRWIGRWIAMGVLCLVAAATPPHTVAQIVEGTVVDAEDERGLPNVSVQVQGTGVGMATNDRGAFVLRLPQPGRSELVLRHLGYQTEVRAVTVSVGERRRLRITLRPVVLGTDEVVVEAEALRPETAARSTGVLDVEALQAARGQTFADAIDALPGVTTLSTGPTIDKPVIRGLHSDRVIVLDNGIRQEGQQWGGEHAPALDPFAPAEVHVVKGAAGVEHGAGAIGGVIRLEPAPLPRTAGVSGDLALDGYSNNRQGAGSLRLEGGVPRADGVGWRVQGSLRRAGDAHTPNVVLRNTAFSERSLRAAAGITRDRFEVEVQVSRYHTDLGIFRGAHTATLEDFRTAVGGQETFADDTFAFTIDTPKQSVTHDLLTAKGQIDTEGGGRVEVQYGVQRNVRQEFDAHCRFCDDPGAKPAFDLDLITHTADLTWRSRPLASGNAFAVVGASGMNQGNENGESGYLIPNFRALTGGVFARTSWMLGDVTLDAGTRVDLRRLRAFPRDFDTRGFAFRTTHYTGVSSVVGALWQWTDTWSLGANLSTAWRPPNVNELYSYGVHHGAAQFEVGNPDLRSERVLGVDATIRHRGTRVRLQASTYATFGRDFISLLPTGDPVVTIRGVFPEFAYRQTGARLVGVDGGVTVDVAGPLTTGATLSVVRGTDTTNDAPLVDMPSDRMTLFAGLRGTLGLVSNAELRLETTLVRRQTRMPDVDFAPAPDGYALASLHVGGTVPAGGTDVQVRASVDNLFNTTYRDVLSRFRYFVDEPGRTVVLRITVPFGI